MQRIIGIDFGTSTTYMNVKRYHGDQPAEDRFSYMPVVFNYGESSGFVSSIVRENADGTFDFGEKAREQLEGAKIYEEVKMSLESPDPDKRAQARRITEQFFRFLYETYAQQTANLGSAEDAEETIVSYPVKWQEETVHFMLEAARKAGFQNVHGMDEATAAVSAVLCQNPNSNVICAGQSGYLMLVDMGAGTTDLVVCRYQADDLSGIQVELVTSWPRTAGEPTFGGREIDAVLERYVEDYLKKALSPALAPMAHGFAADPGKAKMWKERNVSSGLAERKQITTCAYLAPYRPMLTGSFPPFGRAEFEQMAADGLRDYVRLLQGCLADTEAEDDEFAEAGLDLVILTGGHSAWYFAREILDGTMEGYLDHPALALIRSQKARVINLPNPQTTVSLGLVYSKLPFRLSGEATAEAPDSQTGESVPHPDGGQPEEDRSLLGLVKNVLRNDPEFYETNQLSNASLTAEMVSALRVPPEETVLYANNYGTSGKGLSGLLLTDGGIYTRAYIGVATGFVCYSMPWEYAVQMITSPNGTRRFQYGGRDLELPNPAALRALKGLLQAVRGECPVQYHWSAEMRNTVTGFLQRDPEIQRRNCRSQFPDNGSFWQKVGSKYSFELFYVGNFGNGGKHKAIIHAGGLSVRYNQGFLGYSNGPRELVSWEEFLNSDLNEPVFMQKFIQQDFGLGPSLGRLQQLLRSQALGEPAPQWAQGGGTDSIVPPQDPWTQEGSAGSSPFGGQPSDGSDYDSAKCPKCGSPIPSPLKRCPTCGRRRLRDLTIPYKMGGMAWYVGETKVGIAKAAVGTFTILNDRIEYKKHFGNAVGAVVPYYNIYSLARANLGPREIFWLRDVASVKELTYFLGIPGLVITMHNGKSHTFTAALKTESAQDSIRGAVALLHQLLSR